MKVIQQHKEVAYVGRWNVGGVRWRWNEGSYNEDEMEGRTEGRQPWGVVGGHTVDLGGRTVVLGRSYGVGVVVEQNDMKFFCQVEAVKW